MGRAHEKRGMWVELERKWDAWRRSSQRKVLHMCNSHGGRWGVNDDISKWHFSGGTSGKEFACQCRRRGFNPWVRKIPWRKKRQPSPVFLPGESHGQQSLGGYSLWGCKESDRTEAMTCTCCMWNSGPDRHQGRRRLAGGLARGTRAHKACWPGANGWELWMRLWTVMVSKLQRAWALTPEFRIR